MNETHNVLNRKRFSLLTFILIVVVALFPGAPAASALVLTPSFNGGLNLDDNDVVCQFVDRDSDRIECFRVGERGELGPLSQEFSERRIRSGAASPSVNIANSGNNVNLCPTTQQIVNTGNVANEQGVAQYNTDNNDRFPFGGGTVIVDPTNLPGLITGYASRLADPIGGFIATPNGVLVSPDRELFVQPSGVVVIPDDDVFILPHDRFRDIFDDTGDIDLEGSSINIDGSVSSECNQTINQAAAAAPAGVVATAGGAVAAAAPAAAAPAPAPAPAPVAIAGGGGGGVAAKAGGGMLPKTGGAAGAPLFAAIAGMLLTGGGLLAYRRFRS